MDFISRNLILDYQKEIDKYYGIDTNDIFKIRDVLIDYFDCGKLEKIEEGILIRRDEDGAFVSFVLKNDGCLKVEVSDELENREIIRTIDNDGKIHVFAKKEEKADILKKGRLFQQKESSVVSCKTGRIIYDCDGTFLQEEIFYMKREKNFDWKLDTPFHNYSESTTTTNIKDNLLVKKSEKYYYFDPTQNKLEYSYSNISVPGIKDSREKITSLIIGYSAMSKQKYDYLISGLEANLAPKDNKIKKL